MLPRLNFFKLSSLIMLTAGVALTANAATLEEIVVTAQKREQSLQDVSLAVTALTSKEITDNGLSTIDDLQYLMPSIHMGTNFGFANIFVRGLGLNGVFGGIDPAVAVHLDGAVIAQAFEQKSAFFDLERIEYLRGPQGTLYGRNSTGGSINLITAKPTEDLQGYVRGTIGGSDLNLIGEAALSGPVYEDKILARGAIRYQNRDGYGKDITTGDDVDDADQLSLRGHVQINFTNDIDLLLTGDYHREDDRATALHFIRESFPGTTNPVIAATGAGGYATDIRDYGGDLPPVNDREMFGFTGTLTWRLNDQYTLKSISNYRDFDMLLVQDLDLSAVVNGTDQPNPTPGSVTTVQAYMEQEQQFSEELQLHYEGERLRGLAALYYFMENINVQNTVGRNPEVNRESTNRLFLDGGMDVDAWAVFTNWTWDFTDKVAVKAGARYSFERRAVDQNFAVCGGTTQRSAGNCGPPVGPPPPPFTGNGSRQFRDFSPSFGLEFRPVNNVMLYALYSEGFKSGTGAIGAGSAAIVQPEKIKNREVGMKADFLDNTLRVNVAGYDYHVTDAQFDRTIPTPGGNFVTVLENAAGLDGRGVELETQWLATDQLTINGSMTYSDIQFTNFIALDPLDPRTFGGAPVSVQLAGNSPRSTPDFTFAIHPEYQYPLAGGGTLLFAGNVSYKTEIFYSEYNRTIMSQDDYAIFDANLLYTSPDEKLTVNVWGKNISDEEVLGAAFAISTGRVIGGTWLPPRTFGVTVGYNFF